MERCGNGFPGLLHQYSAQQAPRADQPQDIGRKPAEINQTNAQDWHQPQRECATNENWSAARLPDFPVVQQHLPERHRPKVAGRKVPRETGRNLAPLRGFSEMAREMRLTLNSKKTRITKLTQGFDFLGIHFIKQKSLKGGRNTIYLHPSKQAQQSIRNRLKSWTSRNAPINPETFVEQIKPIVWGWVNYFKHTNASKAFKGLQRFINIRFRRYLTHRRK